MSRTSADTRQVVESYWRAMIANDWRAAADHLTTDCAVDWVCTGERIVGRDRFVAVQETYPSATGRWTFDVHRIVVDGTTAVSEVTTSDGEQSARVVAISTVVDGLITAQTEYWPTRYEPPHDRHHLTEPGPQLP